MKRIVSVWLPRWPIERMEWTAPGSVPAEHPFALIIAGAKGLRITALNGPARAAGLYPGQALADARAAVPALMTRPAEPAHDHAALVALAQWCGRYGPNRNIDGGDGLWIEITGAAHLFGGEAALLANLTRRLRGFGISARAAAADTLGAAFVLARYYPPSPRTNGERVRGEGQPLAPYPASALHPAKGRGEGKRTGVAQEALATLPIEGLRLDPESVLLLKRLGLRRIGQLYEIPRSDLARRFRELSARAGDASGRTERAIAVLTRLDQALGRVPEPLEPLLQPPVYSVRRAFADPLVSPEGITAEAAALAAELCKTLEGAAQGARGVRLCLYRADGTWAEARAGTSSPSREPAHMLGLLIEKLATLDAGFGIDVITLEATEVEPLGRSQTSLAELARDSRRDPAILIDRLANRLGAERVLRLNECESYIPERAQRGVSALVYVPPASKIVFKNPLPSTGRGQGWGEELGETPAGVRATDSALTQSQKSLLDRPPTPTLPRQGEGGESTGRFAAESLKGTQSPGLAARPPFLLRRPEPISVLAEVPEGPPARFTWRRLGHRIVKAEGPERIAPEWWRELGAARPSRPRDYYRIEDVSGGRYWVFREGLFGGEAEDDPPRWFLHGVFG